MKRGRSRQTARFALLEGMMMTAAATREVYRHGRDRDFTQKEVLALCDEMSEAMDNGDREAVERVSSIFPVDPGVAKIFKEVYGKEFILDLGFDLTEANLVYGEGWLDEPNEKWVRR